MAQSLASVSQKLYYLFPFSQVPSAFKEVLAKGDLSRKKFSTNHQKLPRQDGRTTAATTTMRATSTQITTTSSQITTTSSQITTTNKTTTTTAMTATAMSTAKLQL